MKLVRSDGSVIEGTAEEIAQFEALQRYHTPHKIASALVGAPSSADISEAEQDWEYVSTDLAFRALTRLRLSNEQKLMLRAIHAGGSNWVSAPDIQNKIGYKPNQFAGLMGAFGRRLINTPGYVLHSAFFEQEWDTEKSCYRYRLPPTVRKAVEKARIVDAK